MKTVRRERFKEATREEIKAVAWGQIARYGAPALSLRAIAREMGLTAPALYRYYNDRDALVTALVIDAFNSFADALEAGRGSRPHDDHAGRMHAIGRAYREWAVAYPQRYTLIFGTPIRGYCPDPETAPAGRRSFGVLLEELNDAHNAGILRLPVEFERAPPSLQARLELLRREAQFIFPAAVVQMALATWSHIHGLVSLELIGQLPGFLGDQTAAFVEEETRIFLARIGLGEKGDT
ncbi:MAG: TetR/AcrR family transcriptional regulator [Spirochaetia bacterium]|jgi:AcrR family transcriptional regulator